MKYIFFILAVAMLSACGHYNPGKTGTIRIKGSDTMLILNRVWAEEYMKAHPQISVYAEGGGSSEGFTALAAGTIDICASSRPIKAFEVRKIAEKHNKLGVAHRVAKDALSIFVNKNNPVQNFTLPEIRGIFTGQITNWKDLGGFDQEILVAIRKPSSGTHLYFKEHVLNEMPYASAAVSKISTDAVIETIMLNENAVGYGGVAYGESVIHASVNVVSPDFTNIKKDLYPISRYLYLYTIDVPTGNVKAFIDWVMSVDGQAVVARAGYIALWDKLQ